MIDCLLIGFNDTNFEEYVKMVQSMGTSSGAYRDLKLAFIEYNQKPYRSMDILNLFYAENKQGYHKPLHNSDFLWPVITYLGTYLARRGFAFDYVNLFQQEQDKLIDKLTKNTILTIAITTTLYVSVQPILEIISFIRKYNTTAKIIVGGPYIYNQTKGADAATAQRLFKYIDADFYVMSSEGEFALASILKALKGGGNLDDVDNIAYRKGPEFTMTATSIESNSLEENMVDYTLFPKEEFGEFVTLRTAKSCPFSCAFCGFPQRAGKYTYLSLDLVEKELNAIRDIGSVTTLTFLDDTLNVPKGRFKEILRLMIRNGYGFKWNSFFRSDHADEETIELMGKAGCEGVFLGVESGSDYMLQKMNKAARQRHYAKAIPLLKAAGISTHASLIVGFPGETYETFQETMDFVESVKPDFFRAQLWYCDPTTPIWKERERYGIKGSAFNWSHDTMDAKTACDLVDKLFLSVENSHWLPQYGFEQWSTFYLQRKGMTMEQVKALVKCFNDVIKEELLHPDAKDIDPQLLTRLKASCQFDEPIQAAEKPIEAFSSPSSVASEQFWLKEFQESPASNIEVLRAGSNTNDGRKTSLLCSIEKSLLDTIRSHHSTDISTLILAAYSILLSRLNGRQDTVIVCATSAGESTSVIPLRLYPSLELSFSEFVQITQQKLLQAMEHRLYALSTLDNASLMEKYGSIRPVFDVGYVFCTVDQQRAGFDQEKALSSYPAIDLLLEVIKDGNDIHMQFTYTQDAFQQEIVQNLASYLQSILEEVSKNSHLLLEEIILDRGNQNNVVLSGPDMDEIFNF